MWNDVANQVETSRDSFDDATSFSLRPVDRLNVARGCFTPADRLIFQRSSVSALSAARDRTVERDHPESLSRVSLS